MRRTPVFVALIALIAGCAAIRRPDTASIPTLEIADLQRGNPQLNALGKTLQEGNPVILFVPKDTVLPLQATVESPVVTLLPGPNQVRFDRDVYLFYSAENVMVSPDKVLWAGFGDMDGVKKLFSLGQGNLQLGLAATEEEGAHVRLVLQTR